MQNATQLGSYLRRCVEQYGPEYLHTDPLGEVHRFERPEDQEIAGFLAAGLAFGQVNTILKNIRELWDRLGGQPSHRAQNWKHQDTKRLKGFVHRWVKGADLAVVLRALGKAQRDHGSLGRLFAKGYNPEAPDTRSAASAFIKRLTPPGEQPRGVATFFCDPEKGSACKRLNLYLRWMIRPKDGLDLGVFESGSPSQLVMPMDTHVARISRYLGLTQRRSTDWKTATEVTKNLKRVDPADPTRFDFAISRLGILKNCPRAVDAEHCRKCSLQPACILGKQYEFIQ